MKIILLASHSLDRKTKLCDGNRSMKTFQKENFKTDLKIRSVLNWMETETSTETEAEIDFTPQKYCVGLSVSESKLCFFDL